MFKGPPLDVLQVVLLPHTNSGHDDGANVSCVQSVSQRHAQNEYNPEDEDSAVD